MQHPIKSTASTLAALAISTASSALANELSLHAGALRAGSDLGSSYSWALEYRRPLSGNFAASFSWLNEGHPESHHRDGQAVQLWWQGAASGSRPGIELGIGPYYFYDTVRAANRQGYANDHGWGVLASAGLNWQLDGPWFASLRLNRVQAPGHHHSTALLAGVGYRGVQEQRAGPSASTASRPSWEFDLMLGRSIRNSFRSENAREAGAALRMRAGEHAALSLTYIDEAGRRVEQRRGIAAQAWVEDDITERFSVGAGIGPYFLTDRARRPDGSKPSARLGVISVTGAYLLNERWVGRLVWNRVATPDDSDSDVVMFALGYRF